jgi:hypothetical protein
MNLGGLIPVLGGIFCLLVAFRVVPVSNNAEANDRWLQKSGTLMKVLGVIVLFGLGEILGIFR